MVFGSEYDNRGYKIGLFCIEYDNRRYKIILYYMEYIYIV